MAADLSVVRAVQAVAVYLALTWLGVFCFGFAAITALLDWGGLRPGGRASAGRWRGRARVGLVVVGAFGLATALVGIGGLLFG